MLTLKQLREKAGFSRKELSYIINVTNVTYSKYEEGYIKLNRMKTITFIRLAVALNVTYDELLQIDGGSANESK